MKRCETDGTLTDGDWSPFYGISGHGVLCQSCAIEYAGGKRAQTYKEKKQELNQFDVPIYPPDDDEMTP